MNNTPNSESSPNKSLKILIFLAVTTVVMLMLTGILSVRLDFDSAHLAEKFKALTADKVADKTNTDVKVAEQNSQAINQTSDILPERHDAVTLVIPPKQQLSYWLAMERDYDLEYSWATDGKPIYGEFQGKHSDVNTNDVKVFAKLTSDKAHALFIVPFTGHFGWHWENKTDQPITVRFTIKGAYKILDNTTQPAKN